MSATDTIAKPTEAEWDDWLNLSEYDPNHPVELYLHGPNTTTPEEYDAYYRRSVAQGLADIAAGRVVSREEVERRSQARQAELRERIKAER